LTRPDLRPGRLLAIWAPLAVTFLLVTGSTPVVNAAINRLPGRIARLDLAAFAILINFTIVLHSPLFVSREIAIRLSIDRDGFRRALRFCLAAGFALGGIELLLGATPLGAALLGNFAEDPRVVAGAHRALLFIWPVPPLIAVRGVFQALQIRADDTIFVAVGTLGRIGLTALFGFWVAPRLGWDGPSLGGLCVTAGLALETVVAVLRTRSHARPAETTDEESVGSAAAFGIPLMFANFLGVAASLFYLRIAGLVPPASQDLSLAAFQEVKPLHWFFASGAFALQSLTTAKVRRDEDVRPMMTFAVLVGTALSLALAVCAFIAPVRNGILVVLMGEERGGAVLALARPALMLAAVMPLLGAIRFGLRGVLISRGRTRAITVSNLTSLLVLSTAVAFHALPSRTNGALNAYVLWLVVLVLELGILLRFARADQEPPAPLPPPIRTPREGTAG